MCRPTPAEHTELPRAPAVSVTTAASKTSEAGFTLVELMIVVAIVGVLAVYGVRKYIANGKTAEAKNAVGQIGKDAATALSASANGDLDGNGTLSTFELLGAITAGQLRLAPSISEVAPRSETALDRLCGSGCQAVARRRSAASRARENVPRTLAERRCKTVRGP